RSFVAVEIDPGVEVFHADERRSVPRDIEMRHPAFKAAAAHHGHSPAQGPEAPFDPLAAAVVLKAHRRQEAAAWDPFVRLWSSARRRGQTKVRWPCLWPRVQPLWGRSRGGGLFWQGALSRP